MLPEELGSRAVCNPYLLGVSADQSNAGSFIPVDIPQCTRGSPDDTLQKGHCGYYVIKLLFSKTKVSKQERTDINTNVDHH